MKEIIYKTSDNTELNGILEENGSETCVIMCHGIRAGKEEHGNFTKLKDLMNSNKIDSFRFDFRGHGKDTSDFSIVTISGELLDIEATINLINNLGYKNIILLGASFGAGIISLLDYTKYNNIKELILWYPAVIYEEVNIFSKSNVEKAVKDGYYEGKSIRTGKVFRFSKELMQETTMYKPYDKLIENQLKKLFVVGDKDILTPCESIIRCSKESPNSELILIKGGTHGFFTEPELFQKLMIDTVDWIKKCLEK